MNTPSKAFLAPRNVKLELAEELSRLNSVALLWLGTRINGSHFLDDLEAFRRAEGRFTVRDAEIFDAVRGVVERGKDIAVNRGVAVAHLAQQVDEKKL